MLPSTLEHQVVLITTCRSLRELVERKTLMLVQCCLGLKEEPEAGTYPSLWRNMWTIQLHVDEYCCWNNFHPLLFLTVCAIHVALFVHRAVSACVSVYVSHTTVHVKRLTVQYKTLMWWLYKNLSSPSSVTLEQSKWRTQVILFCMVTIHLQSQVSINPFKLLHRRV